MYITHNYVRMLCIINVVNALADEPPEIWDIPEITFNTAIYTFN
jgi:hypothetical protein